MTSVGLGVMFEGDSENRCGGKFPLKTMGGQAEGLACTDRGARTPIGMSENFIFHLNLDYHRLIIFFTRNIKKMKSYCGK